MFATERCCCDEAVFGRRRMRPAETKGPLCVEKATLSSTLDFARHRAAVTAKPSEPNTFE